jgi:putative transposase
MLFDSQKHHRRSIRLQGYDYAQPGAYFVTIVMQKREFLFGDVVNGEMMLNQYGQIVKDAWIDLPNHYPYVELDVFCIMPNHLHGILVLKDDNDIHVGAGLRPAPTVRHPLSEVIRAFKSFSSRRINAVRCAPALPTCPNLYLKWRVYDPRIPNRRLLFSQLPPGPAQ